MAEDASTQTENTAHEGTTEATTEHGAATEAQNRDETNARTFTAAEVERMVKDRLERDRAAREKEAERAKLDAVERMRLERQEIEQERDSIRAQLEETRLKYALAPHVTDADYALFKLQQAGDKYLNKDGQVRVEALLKDFPALAAQPTPKAGPAPTTAGGSTARPADMNHFIRQKAGRS